MQSFYNNPSELNDFYHCIIDRLTHLLEEQVRGQMLNLGMIQQVISELNVVHESIQQLDNDAFLEDMTRCQRINATLELLHNEQESTWNDNCNFLQNLIVDVHELIEKLSLTVIDKSLFERQSRVLESIILSHENVRQWQDFVQDILREFHGFFPFNFFTIAFTNENGIKVYLYYLGEYNKDTKKYARKKLTTDLLASLNKPSNALVDIEEFQITGISQQRQVKQMEFIQVSVANDSKPIGGVLGVGYACDFSLSMQEQGIIRSLLSVMVMVVGSSKSLSHSLSELEFYAEHDPLTGLHNRRYFNEILAYEVDRSGRHQHDFTVFSIDIDNFKLVNDSHGHLVGDQVLIHLAQLLKKSLRKGDVLARMGGDEFMIILPETPVKNGRATAEVLRKKVSQFDFSSAVQASQMIPLNISIGCAVFPGDADNMKDLLSGADLAMYEAKKSGKNFVCSVSDMGAGIAENKKMVGLSDVLQRALEQQRVVPYFQPIIDCKTGKIYSYEALARLETEDGDIISAGIFIDTADKYGISLALDHIMLRKVTEFMAEKYTETGEMPLVFVNLTPQEIQHRNILEYASSLCEKHAIPPNRIVFEITEREAISDLSNMRKFLTVLRERGFAFALDDFGSGYNSFHYLRELHFEYVKIDGAFITNLLTSKVDNALVSTLNQLCQELGMKTLAEFVESEAIMTRLQAIGIDLAQGFHLGLPQSDFTEAL